MPNSELRNRCITAAQSIVSKTVRVGRTSSISGKHLLTKLDVAEVEIITNIIEALAIEFARERVRAAFKIERHEDQMEEGVDDHMLMACGQTVYMYPSKHQAQAALDDLVLAIVPDGERT